MDNISLVGSIGAITIRLGLNSYLTEKKIERRKISSNEFDFRKFLLQLKKILFRNSYLYQNDIFSKITDKEISVTSDFIKNIHDKFIEHVLLFRKNKLKVLYKSY